jgi:hypothetical protein
MGVLSVSPNLNALDQFGILRFRWGPGWNGSSERELSWKAESRLAAYQPCSGWMSRHCEASIAAFVKRKQTELFDRSPSLVVDGRLSVSLCPALRGRTNSCNIPGHF